MFPHIMHKKMQSVIFKLTGVFYVLDGKIKTGNVIAFFIKVYGMTTFAAGKIQYFIFFLDFQKLN